MRPSRDPAPDLKAPPYAALHGRMMKALEALEGARRDEDVRALREAIEEWWRAQQEWNGQLAHLFGVHHEINNALVGIRGNAQLIQRGAAGLKPGVLERLEVVIRESQRIQEAVGRLRDAKAALHGEDPASRAA